MCVISFKPIGAVISRSDLWEMNQANPHGMGVAYKKDGLLHFDKQMFNRVSDFRSFVHRNAIAMNSDIESTWHFRIATAGGVSADKCHPFMICNTMTMPLKGTTKTPLLFHNGDVSHYLSSRFNRLRYSDTQYAAYTMFKYFLAQYSYDKISANINKLSQYFAYNKFVIMFHDKPSLMIGTFYKEQGGLYVSNNFWNSRYINNTKNVGWWNF